ncbi:MAG: histidine--tRNA ligase [Acidimicrobiales bacterium]
MAEPTYRAPKGTRDLLAPASTRFRSLVATFAELAAGAGFGEIVPPMFEDIGVFQRIGEATDVVTKEMYSFETKGGDRFALRPEQTASIVRAFVEHRPDTPWKAWYAGPNFRYERPQAGRYRQFDQVGVEVLGTDDAAADVEVIALGWRFYEAVGLRRVTLKLNSLGTPEDLAGYVAALHAYLTANSGALSAQGRATLERNPLRVLDSKRPEDAEVIAASPLITEHLSAAAAAHFDKVMAGLSSLGIAYTLAPHLVRGLDYYTRTTFEYAADALETSQDAVGGGGRYDGLAEALGGPPTPGIGFALGVDRVLLACDAEGVFPPPRRAVDVFVVDVVDGTNATVIVDALRRAGLRADRAFDRRSMKSQMKRADASGAALAVIIGEQEVAEGTVVVRDLRTSEQESVARDEMIERVRKLTG